MTIKSFLLGLAAGVILAAGLFVLRPAGIRGPAPAPTPAVMPAAQASSADLETRLEESQRANLELQRKLDEAKGRVAYLEAVQKEQDERTAKSEPSGAPPKPETPAEPSKEAVERAKLRMGIQIGKPLGDDAAAYLGLDPTQRQAIDAVLAAEGKHLYGFLREIAAEGKAESVPTEDGVGVLMAAIGPAMQTEIPKLTDTFKDADVLTGKKEVYLDEILGPQAVLVRMTERLDEMRQQTITAASRVLQDEQKAKFATLFTRNFNFGGGQFSMSENVYARRK